MPLTHPKRGFKGHGVVGLFYSVQEYRERLRQHEEGLDNLVQGMNEDQSSGDEEAARLTNDQRVRFEQPPAEQQSEAPMGTPTGDDLRDSIKQGTTRAARSKKSQGRFILGLEHPQSGIRLYENDYEQVAVLTQTGGFVSVRTFRAEEDAEFWVLNRSTDGDTTAGSTVDLTNGGPDPSSSESSDDDKKSRKSRIGARRSATGRRKRRRRETKNDATNTNVRRRTRRQGLLTNPPILKPVILLLRIHPRQTLIPRLIPLMVARRHGARRNPSAVGSLRRGVPSGSTRRARSFWRRTNQPAINTECLAMRSQIAELMPPSPRPPTRLQVRRI